ncbi:MAG: metallophosphoesterase, partial [Flammeovirgaceae bacterium]|nr:metallophosphoesterase [Flammeovirgaceae bacterium]
MALEKLKSVIGKLYRSSNNNSFPYYFHIPKTKTGRRFVIADIHGCYQSFKELIKKIELRKEDQLFLLGDFVDRGPNSSGVFNVIFSLLKNEFQVFPLRGNHEQMLIELAIQDENLVKWSLEKNNASDLMCGEG